MTSTQPVYQPISFVSPISDTTHHRHDTRNLPVLRRLSEHLGNSFTLEDSGSATRRESIISDQGAHAAEAIRRASISGSQDKAHDRALQAWRTQSVDMFWAKHGEVDESGVRRKSLTENSEEEMVDEGRSRRASVDSGEGKWRRMSWGGKREWGNANQRMSLASGDKIGLKFAISSGQG
ncbi:hypothetical protein E8E11_004398 [Didymella keratinophila]|nr:hypothetical protein E8E11_004398 [Didymella keratinophila]